MEVYPNHTFQPEAAVRRGDLAQAASRVLALIGRRAAGAGRRPGATRAAGSSPDVAAGAL